MEAKRPPLRYDLVDCHGYKPDLRILDRRVVHRKTGGNYRIVGFAWNCEHDDWAVVYVKEDISLDPEDNVPCCRRVVNFYGMAGGQTRFVDAPGRDAYLQLGRKPRA